jgi:tRNA A-37 threonylcarbamoyl transferase component Bud32
MAIRSSGACPKCAGEVQDGWRVCPACAAPLLAENGERETRTVFSQASSSSSGIDEGRFPAGTVLAGRYRVLGLLGKGGMGEVYRAYDQILNQAVALKFLAHGRMDEAALVRFRNEVRIARQVSHPNVCRVYDIGSIEGQHFLSMEYLDGEDLDSLIRRIGRLPQDKAIEFTRKICAGLAAAHERGILHRDLKPANIMIDGRGQVRIMDFGLAALAAEVPLSDLRSGTPAYMSPEQKAGKEVTMRSDLYSLGLVLYEMFTGKRRSNEQSSPTEIIRDLDPSIDRIILRCLEEEPKRRPSSALNVAMALPGADPIAAALAAGETPSPEMVAASGEKEGFSPRTAARCFAGLLILLALMVLVPSVDRGTLMTLAPLEIPPDGLAFRAQDILKQLGYPEKPKATAYGFENLETGYLSYLQQHNPGNRDELLASHQPPVIGFWYRQHGDYIGAYNFFGPNLLSGVVSYNLPVNSEPGMIRMILDAKGRLFALEARPPEKDSREKSRATGGSVFDWAVLFQAAGLDPGRFTPATPERTPPMAFDERMAWVGTYAEGREEKLRVEAASWQGRPVFFGIRGDWPSPAVPPGAIAPLFVILAIAVGAGSVAWNNLRLGRSDRRGATKLATFTFVLMVVAWAPVAAHVPGLWELGLIVMALSFAGFCAAMIWLLYVAIEPYVRRHWPDALISWTRLQAGRVRDPLVASHVLAGILANVAFGVGVSGLQLAVMRFGPPWQPLLPTHITQLDSIASLVSDWLFSAAVNLFVMIGFVLAVVLFRLLIRRVWIADIVGAIVFGVFGLLGGGNVYQNAIGALTFALAFYVEVRVLRRFGLLAQAVMVVVVFTLLPQMPVTFGTWYAGRELAGVVIMAAVAAWALWVIVSAGRRPATESAGY